MSEQTNRDPLNQNFSSEAQGKVLSPEGESTPNTFIKMAVTIYQRTSATGEQGDIRNATDYEKSFIQMSIEHINALTGLSIEIKSPIEKHKLNRDAFSDFTDYVSDLEELVYNQGLAERPVEDISIEGSEEPIEAVELEEPPKADIKPIEIDPEIFTKHRNGEVYTPEEMDSLVTELFSENEHSFHEILASEKLCENLNDGFELGLFDSAVVDYQNQNNIDGDIKIPSFSDGKSEDELDGLISGISTYSNHAKERDEKKLEKETKLGIEELFKMLNEHAPVQSDDREDTQTEELSLMELSEMLNEHAPVQSDDREDTQTEELSLMELSEMLDKHAPEGNDDTSSSIFAPKPPAPQA